MPASISFAKLRCGAPPGYWAPLSDQRSNRFRRGQNHPLSLRRRNHWSAKTAHLAIHAIRRHQRSLWAFKEPLGWYLAVGLEKLQAGWPWRLGGKYHSQWWIVVPWFRWCLQSRYEEIAQGSSWNEKRIWSIDFADVTHDRAHKTDADASKLRGSGWTQDSFAENLKYDFKYMRVLYVGDRSHMGLFKHMLPQNLLLNHHFPN